jgi:UDP-N-acetylmuramyl pentapeptide synthase
MPHILGENGIYAALAAAAVALHFGMNLMQIAEALRSFRLPAGRVQLLLAAGRSDSRAVS